MKKTLNLLAALLLIASLSFDCFAQFVKQDSVASSSLDPSFISSTAAASGWRESHAMGFHYLVEDANSESDSIDQWARELMLAFRWSWLAIELGHTPGMTNDYHYQDDTQKQEVTKTGNIAHIALSLGDTVSLGQSYSSEIYRNSYFLTIAGTDMSADEDLTVSSSGSSISLKFFEGLYISAAVQAFSYSNDGTSLDALDRVKTTLGIAYEGSESDSVNYRAEVSSSVLDEAKESDPTIHLPYVRTDILILEEKWWEYLFSISFQNILTTYEDLLNQQGFGREIKEQIRRYGLIYIKESGPTFGVYLRDFDKMEKITSQSSSVTKEYKGNGYEVRIGYTF